MGHTVRNGNHESRPDELPEGEENVLDAVEQRSRTGVGSLTPSSSVTASVVRRRGLASGGSEVEETSLVRRFLA